MEILKLPTGQIRQPGLILRNSLADKVEQDFACIISSLIFTVV